MKRFRKFLNDLREPLGIGMKRLMIALAIILGIVIVTIAANRAGVCAEQGVGHLSAKSARLPVLRGG